MTDYGFENALLFTFARLREDLRKIGERDTNFGSIVASLTFRTGSWCDQAVRGEAETRLRLVDLMELSAYREIARRAGERFAAFADLCDRILLERVGA